MNSNKRNLRVLKKEGKKKRVRFVLFTCLFVLLLCAGMFYAVERFIRIKEVLVFGNRFMKDEEILSLVNLKKGDPIFGVSKKEIYKRLKRSSWIKDLYLRKELSGRILIKIFEAQPVAIARINDRSYLIDNGGIFLEELKDETAFFLPVIKDIDPKGNKETFMEAVNFVNALNKKGLSQSPNIEIYGQRKEDISLKFESISIRIGAGDFDTKLERLLIVKDEIQKRNLNVEYIDLRFENKVVVKTIDSEPENKKKTEKNERNVAKKRKKR